MDEPSFGLVTVEWTLDIGRICPRRSTILLSITLLHCTSSGPRRHVPPVEAEPPRPAAVAREPQYACNSAPLAAAMRQKVRRHSWREGCPVDPEELSHLELTHWGYDS